MTQPQKLVDAQTVAKSGSGKIDKEKTEITITSAKLDAALTGIPASIGQSFVRLQLRIISKARNGTWRARGRPCKRNTLRYLD